jgi:hypothetical protein
VAFTMITVTRSYKTAAGRPAAGTVKFTPSNPMVNGPTVISAPVVGTLDRAGLLSLPVAANNDPATDPVGSYYTVVESLTGQPSRSYAVVVPYNAAAGTVDLSTLSTITVPAGSVGGGSGGTVSLPATMLHRVAQTSSGYPSRPTPGYVDWFGTTDPGAALLFGDTWTQIPVTAPNAPTIGTATGGNAQASVVFTAPTWNGGATITSYTATSTPGSLTATGSSSPLTVTGLTNGTSYTFKVKATNSVGAGPDSAASNSVTPTGGGGGATVPGAPTIGTATAGDTTATVAFTAPGSNGGSAITSYTVTSTPGSITGTGSSSPITVTGLTNGTAYTFKVAATNGVGTGTQSAASNSVTPTGSGTALTDTFTGTNGAAWSSTVWNTQPASPNIFASGWTIQNNHGRISGTSAGSFESTGRQFNLPDSANWRVRAHIVTPPTVSGWEFQLVLQATTWSATSFLPETGYVVRGTGGAYAVLKYVSGATTVLQSTTLLDATDRWIDAKVVGGVFSIKAWTGLLSDAPASYTTLTNTTPLTGTGKAGIYFAAAGGEVGLTQIDIDDVLVDNNPA